METNNSSDSKQTKNQTSLKKILSIGCGCLLIIVLFIVLGLTFLSKFIASNFPTIFSTLSQKLGYSIANSEQGFTLSDKDTKIFYNAGDNRIPSSFPTDVPIPEGVKVTSTLSSDAGKADDSHWLTLSTSLPYEQVTQFYTSKLKENGWSIDNTVTVGDGTTLTFKKNSRVGSISIGRKKDDSETTVVIILGNENNSENNPSDSPNEQYEVPSLEEEGSM